MQQRNRRSLWNRLGVEAIAGAVLVGLALWGFAVLADEVPERGWMVRGDTTLAAFMHTHETVAGQQVFSIITLLGREILILAIAVQMLVFLHRKDRFRAAALAITTILGALVENVLKHIFHRGRPEFAWTILSHHSWSFPSGHAMNSIVGYGALLYFALELQPPRAVKIVLGILTPVLLFIIGLSRVYLGAHYVSDVVAGWLGGIIWLGVCFTAYRLARQGQVQVQPQEQQHRGGEHATLA